MSTDKPLALSLGEPAGIGPDLALQLAANGQLENCLVFADRDLLVQRAAQLNLPMNCQVEHIPLKTTCVAGQLNPKNAAYVLECLAQASQAALDQRCHALVTGPINKAVINQAGIAFSGHTEWLQNFTGTKQVVMLLANTNMRVVPLTRHIPIQKVADAITETLIIDSVKIIAQDFKNHFGINAPRIAICGLNPHAGEQGHIGQEEIEIISPAIENLQQQGLNIIGPISADTAFTKENLKKYDVIVTMFHDQGLPVIKAQGFGDIVNITLGLPLIRTSVDHGTALELAGTGQAHSDSLLNAIKLARSFS